MDRTFGWQGVRAVLVGYVGSAFRLFLWTFATTGLMIVLVVALCSFLVAWDGSWTKGAIGAAIGACGGLVLGVVATLQYTAYSIIQSTTQDLKLGEQVSGLLLGKVEQSRPAENAEPAAESEPGQVVTSGDVVQALRQGARSVLQKTPGEPGTPFLSGLISKAAQSAMVWGAVRVLSGRARQLAGKAGRLDLSQLRSAALGNVDGWILSAVRTRLLLAGAAFATIVLAIVLVLALAVRGLA